MKTIKASFTYEDKTYDFKMRNRVSFFEMSSIIRTVIASEFVDGDFFPELREYEMQKQIVTVFTDIKLLEENTTEEINKNYELIFGSNLRDVIRDNAEEQIVWQIEECIDKSEAYEMRRSKLDSILDLMLTGNNAETEGDKTEPLSVVK